MSARTPLYVLDLECGHRRYIRAANGPTHHTAVAPAGRASCPACNGQPQIVALREAVVGVDVHAKACVDDEGRIECGCGLADHLADLHEVERRRIDEVADA